MTTNVKQMSNESVITFNRKIFGIIKLTRPQFLIAYLIIGSGGIVTGLWRNFDVNPIVALYSIIIVLISAIGVHFRDEAGDWASGYDFEIGGMGVIREGIISEEKVRLWGRIISLITILLGVFQASYLVIMFDNPILFIIGIPIISMIIFVNYLTEEIPLGHETITAGSYLASYYWVYFAQSWEINSSIIFFSIFIYLIIFALIPYQDIGDLKADVKTGKKTLVSILGLDGVGHLSIFTALFSVIFLYLALLM